jgi:dTDP-4-dehydrorhamnose reductase
MDKKPLAWITGAQGLFGNYLVNLATSLNLRWKVKGVSRLDFDLTDENSIEAAYRQDRPDLIIHCAALSQSAPCEANPALARRINVGATKLMADLAGEGRFLFFSTDLVFDGKKGDYVETDSVNPLNVYAETKAEAEPVVLKHPNSVVIRTSLNGGVSTSGNRGFNEELLNIWRRGENRRLFVDEFRCPASAKMTSTAIWELAQTSATGIFHVAGGEKMSRFEIGQLVAARHPELNAEVQAGSLKDYVGPPRAADTTTDCSKVNALLSSPLPGLAQWLAENPEEQF